MSVPRYWLLTQELDQMSRYITLIHSHLQETSGSFENYLEIQVADLPEEEREASYNDYYKHIVEFRDEFPGRFYSSFVISWYSFAENELFRLCEFLNLKITISIHDSESYGSGIKRAYRFLEAAKEYKVDNTHWVEFTNVRRVRNILVHKRGKLGFSLTKPSDTRKFVSMNVDDDVAYFVLVDNTFYGYLISHNMLGIRGGPHIMPTFDYCRHLIDFGLELFSTLYRDMELIE